MRLLAWILTIAFALTGLSLWVGGGFLGADLVARGLGVLAIIACPILWAKQTGLIPEPLAPSGKSRFMLGLALIFAVPLFLPWQYWL